MIITLVITAVIDSVFLCGAIDADAQFLPQFFFRIVFNEADSLVFTICLHEVNVDARVFVLRAYFDLEYSAIWHDKSVCGGLGCFRYRLKRNRDKLGGRTKEKLDFPTCTTSPRTDCGWSSDLGGHLGYRDNRTALRYRMWRN